MGFADEIFDDLKRRRDRAMRSLVEEVANDLRQLVSVPVQRTRVAGRRVTIRSKPGEPPRKETGKYRDSIKAAVEVTANQITGSVYTTSKIGTYLELGTERMDARPHWHVIYRKWSERAPDYFVELMFNG